MSPSLRTFSESWHRIAHARLSLRPTVRARRQHFRGEDWVILEDPFNNRFYRLRPEAYQFVARLDPEHSVDEIWQQTLTHTPESAPGQEEVIQILSQLHQANLLYAREAVDSRGLYARHEKQRKKEFRAKLASIMFARIPLFDPTPLLVPILRALGPLAGWPAMLLWLVVVIFGGKQAIDHAGALLDQSQSVLAPDNLILLYLATIWVKVLHEFGHALVCRHYGGEVRTMGVMLIVFTPLPYMDATSSWRFRSRWQRAFVGAAGMWVEIFLAAVAAIVWANTGNGMLHSLAYNIMFVASVSTIVFNANPLLRFDGYYIFSDLLDIPNLYQRSRQQLQYLCERHLFRLDSLDPVAELPHEGFWLASYGVLSAIYRLIVFAGILLFVGDQYLILGVLMAIGMVIAWLLVPPWKLYKYLTTHPRLEKHRGRASGTVAGGLIFVLAFLLLIPMPDRFRAQGIVQAKAFTVISTGTSGRIDTLLATPGTWVKQGTPLIRMSSPELDNQIAAIEARWRQTEAEERKALFAAGIDLAAIASTQKSVAQQRDFLYHQRRQLTVHAGQSGHWSAPHVADLTGSWVARGTPLGQLIDSRHYRFTAVISQDEATALFDERIRTAEVRIHGDESRVLTLTHLDIVPAEQSRLPSAALGWRGGGEQAVNMDDQAGLQTTEPYFRVDGQLPEDTAVNLMHGRTGTVRFTLPPKPLAYQWYRDLRQVLQRRYQL